MSAESLKLFDVIAEQSCCSICKGFLSCSPIRVLPDGSSICGRCIPPNPDISTYRDLVLENILNKISFPCPFREEGCTERPLFGQVTMHEAKCTYRILSCLATDCTWQGTALTLFDHFIKEHKDHVKKKPVIKLQLAESTEGIFIVLKGSVTFVISYFYDSSRCNFTYDIRYHAGHTDYSVSFVIKLINNSESDYVINVKPKTCLVFDESFYDLQNRSLLNIKKFCEALDNPDAIKILIDVIVTQTKAAIQSLELFTCSKCCNYLIPPLFHLNTDVVCCDCGKNDSKCIPSNNEELLERISEINFPCRWRNCHFSGKHDVYKNHESNCKFYMRKCFFLNCTHNFMVSNAIDHYKTVHDAEFFVDKIVEKIKFSLLFNRMKRILNTVKYGAYILFQHKMEASDNGGKYIMWILSTNPDNITASVNFEHQHCTLKPKPFKLIDRKLVTVTLDKFPPCFTKTDEITVTVTIK